MWGESSRFSQGVVKIQRNPKAIYIYTYIFLLYISILYFLLYISIYIYLEKGVVTNAKFVKHIRPGSDILRLLDWNEQFSGQFLYDMFTFFLECPLFDYFFVSRLTPWSKQTCTHATWYQQTMITIHLYSLCMSLHHVGLMNVTAHASTRTHRYR